MLFTEAFDVWYDNSSSFCKLSCGWVWLSVLVCLVEGTVLGSGCLVGLCKLLKPHTQLEHPHTGESYLSQIFWEHENLSDLSVIWLIYIKLYREKEKNLVKNLG